MVKDSPFIHQPDREAQKAISNTREKYDIFSRVS